MTTRRFILLALASAAAACTRPAPVLEGVPTGTRGSDGYWVPPASAIPKPSPAPVAPPPDLNRLTLVSVVDIALRNNPVTRISWAAANLAADEFGATRGQLYPSVAAGFAATPNRALPSPGRAAVERTQIGPSVSLSYLVFDFGGRDASIDAARITAVAAGFSHNSVVQNTILGTESAVFNYLGTRALRASDSAVVEEAKTNLAAANDRHDVGLATIADVLQAKTALSQAVLAFETLDGVLGVAKAGVAVAMGFPATTAFEVPDVPADDSVRIITQSVDSLIQIAQQARPDLAVARAQLAAAASNVTAVKSENRPSLAFTGTSGYFGSAPAGSSGASYTLSLGLQLPVFTGYANEYHARAAEDELTSATARAEQVRQEVVFDVVSSYSILQTAARRVRAAADLLESATQSEQVAQARYRGGVGTISDLLLAQSALADASAQSIQIRWQWRQALAQLAHDMGTLGIHGEPDLTRDTHPGGN